MGACIRWILLGASGLLSTALFGPFVDELLKQSGIDSSTWVQPMVSLLSASWAPAWLYVAAYLIFGATIGAWLHYTASIFDKGRPSKSDKLSNLAYEFDNLIGHLNGMVTYWKADRSSIGKWTGEVFGRLCALHASLNKLGIRTPDPSAVRQEKDCFERVERMIVFLSIMREMAYKGHYEETKKMGREVTGLFESQFSATNRD